jgi:putative acetyltransferase
MAGENSEYPDAVDLSLVGTYPALAHSGGGYVWDAVLEYRVWCHPGQGETEDGDDYYYAFGTYAEAFAFSEQTPGAEPPLALIRQLEYIDEPEPGVYAHIKEPRVTEWPVAFLRRSKRTDETIPAFFAPDAPANRLDILRGLAVPPGFRTAGND